MKELILRERMTKSYIPPYEKLIIFTQLTELLLEVFWQISYLVSPDQVDSGMTKFGTCLFLMAIFILWAKIKFEGSRLITLLHMMIYFSLFLATASHRMKWVSRVWLLLSSFLFAFQFKIYQKYPTMRFPQPTGQYLVGFREFRLKDNARTEVSVFYPAASKTRRDQKWIPLKDAWKTTRDIMKSRVNKVPLVPPPDFLLKFTSQFDSKLKMGVEVNAAYQGTVEPGGVPRVILISHGFASHRNASSVLGKQLASEGYVVFCPQHYEPVLMEYEIAGQIPADAGEEIKIRKSTTESQILTRSAQLRGLVDFVTDSQNWSAIFGGDNPAPAKEVCLIGQGVGASSVLTLGLSDSRILGVIALDPIVRLIKDSYLAKQLRCPLFIINSGTNYSDKVGSQDLHRKANQDFLKSQPGDLSKAMIIIHKSGHLNQIDAAFVNPGILESIGKVHRKDTVGEIWQIYEAAILTYLKNPIYCPKHEASGAEKIIETLSQLSEKLRLPGIIENEYLQKL